MPQLALDERVHAEVLPVVAGLGFALVEATVAVNRHTRAVRIVIYRPEGISIDDCTAVAKVMRYRIEAIPGLQDASLEVSSPGTDRTIKDPREYAVFTGRGVRILLDDASDWQQGVIEGYDEPLVHIETESGRVSVDVSGIRKARLDVSAEDE